MTEIAINTKCFSLPIDEREVPLLRGAIINMIQDDNLLFHGHTENGLRYSYPLIQYKQINGLAAIVGISDGAVQVGRIETPSIVRLGSREAVLEEAWRSEDSITGEESDRMIDYHISNWLPLNQINYQEFLSADGLVARYSLLEHILTGNLLSLFKGLGIFLNFKLKATIQQVGTPRIMEYKNQGLTAFNADFSANILLPDHIGIGKGSSIGFGNLNKHNNNQ